MEERSTDDEISQKALIHSFINLLAHIFISIGTQRASFQSIDTWVFFFLYFSLLIFPFSTIILLFFIINVISVCCFPRRTVTLKPTVYSRQKEPTGRMSYLSKLWSCIVKHCCLWLLFHFCPIFLFLIYPHTGVTVSCYDIKCCFALWIWMFYRFFGYSRVGDLLCLDLAELLL